MSYVVSLAAGVLVGVVYGLLAVRSPAPPTIALVGPLGILLGEQVVPLAKRALAGEPVTSFLRESCAAHIFGALPHNAACAGGSPKAPDAAACAVHGQHHTAALAAAVPTCDLKGFWGALSCGCWAV